VKEVDLRDLACPGPVIQLKEQLAAGELSLRLHVRDELARSNVMRFARSRGAEAQADEDGQGGFYVAIDARGVRLDVQLGEEFDTLCALPGASRSGPVVVQVTSEKMGEGDGDLGALLMRGFLKTQLQLSQRPDRMVFYNAGVHLCCEGSPLLDDLRQLAEEGVEIIACGTCLNYFGKAQELRVGRVTDMLEIATWLSEAGSVLRP